MTRTIEPDNAVLEMLVYYWAYAIWKHDLRESDNIVLQDEFDARNPPNKNEHLIISMPGPTQEDTYGHRSHHIDRTTVGIEVHSWSSSDKMKLGKNEVLRICDLALKNPVMLNIGDAGSSYRFLKYEDKGQDISTPRVHKWIINVALQENLSTY